MNNSENPSQVSPDAHSEAMAYVANVLGLGGNLQASKEPSPSSEELEPLEQYFFSRSLEELISSGGDRLYRELDLIDDDSGDRYKIIFQILKLAPLAAQDFKGISHEMKLEYELLNWRKRAERAEERLKELEQPE